MFLCRFVFACVVVAALSHDQHEVLFAASKRHQVLVGVGRQRLLNTQMHRYLCYDIKKTENNVGTKATGSFRELR